MVNPFLAGALLVAGLAFLIGAAWVGYHRYRLHQEGWWVGSDLPSSPGRLLRSSRWGLVGRPDEIRQRADGRWIAVEVKSRPAPSTGPPFSHRIQVAAYCLLIEEVTGRPPPYGLLRYGDGQEFRIEWTPARRAELLELRRELAVPYDGRATPSPARCGRCPWNAACDRAAV